MKIAIIGTQNSDTTVDEHDILQRIAVEGLQRMAGYVPAKIHTDNFVLLPPLHKKFIDNAELIIQTLLDDEYITEFNPRMPYLLLAWICLAFDIPVANITLITKQITSVYLGIALGDEVSRDYLNRLDENAWNAWEYIANRVEWADRGAIEFSAARNTWAARLAKDVMDGSDSSIEYDIRDAREARGIMIDDFIPLAMDWLHIDDANCLRIARELLYKMFGI